MNNNQQSNTPIIQKPSNNVLIIILVVIITALVVGGVMYYYQTTVFNKEKSELEDRIKELEDQIEEISVDGDYSYKDWQTYKNTEYGFEVRFPKSFEVTEEDSYIEGEFQVSMDSTESIYGLYAKDFYIDIDIMENNEGLSAKDWYQNYYDLVFEESEQEGGPFNLPEPSSGKEISVNNLSVFQINSGGPPYDGYLRMTIFTNKDNAYSIDQGLDIQYLEGTDDKSKAFRDIHNMILSTFKFTD